MKFPRLFAASVALAMAPVSFGDTIGSPLVHRSSIDTNTGQVYIYDGITQPFQSSGNITSWAFFDDQSAGVAVTPLLFKIDGNNTFTVAGIGTTVISTGTGVQNYAFGLIAGSAAVTAGQYTFGFTDRAYSIVSNQLTAGASDFGPIEFDGPQVLTDQWEVTADAVTGGQPITLQVGSEFGNAGQAFYADPTKIGRIYSATATVPEPGAFMLLVVGAGMLALRRRRPVSA